MKHTHIYNLIISVIVQKSDPNANVYISSPSMYRKSSSQLLCDCSNLVIHMPKAVNKSPTRPKKMTEKKKSPSKSPSKTESKPLSKNRNTKPEDRVRKGKRLHQNKNRKTTGGGGGKGKEGSQEINEVVKNIASKFNHGDYPLRVQQKLPDDYSSSAVFSGWEKRQGNSGHHMHQHASPFLPSSVTLPVQKNSLFEKLNEKKYGTRPDKIFSREHPSYSVPVSSLDDDENEIMNKNRESAQSQVQTHTEFEAHNNSNANANANNSGQSTEATQKKKKNAGTQTNNSMMKKNTNSRVKDQDNDRDKDQDNNRDKGRDKGRDKNQDNDRDKDQDKDQDNDRDKGQDKRQDKNQDDEQENPEDEEQRRELNLSKTKNDKNATQEENEDLDEDESGFFYGLKRWWSSLIKK